MIFRKITSSLRFKLIISSVIIQIVFVSILVINSIHLVDDSLLTQAKLRVTELERLLNSSIAGRVIEQDIASIQEIFSENTDANSIFYLILLDENDRPLVSSNWKNTNILPEKSTNIEHVVTNSNENYHGSFPVYVEGVKYGEVLYGISTDFFSHSRRALFSASVAIAIAGLFFSTIALFLIGHWLTRNVDKLNEASEAFANGDLGARVAINSNDEISQLGLTFNNMADALDKRISDLNSSREAQKELLEISNAEKARLSSLLKVMSRGILFVANNDAIVYYNPAFIKIWGIHESQNLQNKRILDLVQSLEIKIEKDKNSGALFNKSMTSEPDGVELEVKSGSTILQRFYPVYDDKKQMQGTLWIFEDVTRERQTAKQLVYLAERDFLTGLRNRRRFHEELVKQLDVCQRHVSSLAVLFFDIDDFKYINDAYGHQCGDDLLVKVAGGVGTLVRKDEMFCRLGGDEFAILLPDSNIEGVSNLAQRILSAVSNISMHVGGHNLNVTSSIGVAVYPLHAENSEDLMACADVAMYQAKESGKNTWKVYEESAKASQHLLKRIDWENRIKSALIEDGFVLNFQGVYDASSGALSFLEVLVRMKGGQGSDPQYYPGQFINFAEKSGSIVEIDRHVIEKSVKYLSQNESVPCLSVNVSGRSFDDPSLDRFILQALNTYKVDASRLMIELTETAAVSDLQDAQRFIDSMRQFGCKIAIDDFGAGYSSFVYLKHLEADIIKIDGLFTHDLVNDIENQVFIKAIVDMAKGLGRKTVAEFVEDEKTLQMVADLGVDMVQGYYLQEPASCALI